MGNVKEFLEQAEILVRQGRSREVRAKLSDLSIKSLPRRLYAQFANISNRVGFPVFGLKLLNPVVREFMDATAKEKLEYADLLTSVGAWREAFELMNEIDVAQNPRVNLYKSYILFSQWAYSDAVPLLETYVKHSELGAYDKLVGQMNLATALAASEQLDRAAELFCEIADTAKLNKYELLHNNASMMLSEVEIARGEYSTAKKLLIAAKAKFGETHIANKILIERWEAYADFHLGQKDKAITELRRIRHKAIEIQQWEIARDTDYKIAELTNDRDLATRVYVGTPYSEYRDRIAQKLNIEHCAQFTIQFNEGLPKLEIDLIKGLTNGEPMVSESYFKLLLELSVDFYKGTSLASLHANMFPDEHYNPESTPNKMYQLIHRFKNWSTQEGLGIDIVKEYGFYRITYQKSTAVTIPVDRRASALGFGNVHYGRLVDAFSGNNFSAVQAAGELKVSRRYVLRLLKSLREYGMVEAHGSQRTRTYQMVCGQKEAS